MRYILNRHFLNNVTCTRVFVLIYLLTPIYGEESGECSGKCETTELQAVQIQCQSEEANLLQHETSDNFTALCQALKTYFFCVGEHVPVCIDKVTEELYNSYFQSPYDCHLLPDDVNKIQSYRFSCKTSTSSTPAPSTVLATKATTTSLDQTTGNRLTTYKYGQKGVSDGDSNASILIGSTPAFLMSMQIGIFLYKKMWSS